MLSWPAGTWLVGLGGVILIGVGLWNAYRGLARKFEDKWNTGHMGAAARRWGGRAGVVGHLARAVVFTLIGVFVIRAALQYDPKEAIGLDGALQKLASADLRAVPARAHGCRADRVRPLLPGRRALPRRLGVLRSARYTRPPPRRIRLVA